MMPGLSYGRCTFVVIRLMHGKHDYFRIDCIYLGIESICVCCEIRIEID